MIFLSLLAPVVGTGGAFGAWVLIKSIAIATNAFWFGRISAEAAEICARMDILSGREREVLGGLVAGHANKVIAFDLGISPRTVEIYRANVMTKMKAASLSELVRMAMLAERG